MPYAILEPYSSNSERRLPIDANRYRAISDALDNLWCAIGIEEKFDALVENYAELEQDLFNLAMRYSVFSEQV